MTKLIVFQTVQVNLSRILQVFIWLFTVKSLLASYKCPFCCCIQDIVDVYRIGSASFLQVSFLLLYTGYCWCLQDRVCQLPTSVLFDAVYCCCLQGLSASYKCPSCSCIQDIVVVYRIGSASFLQVFFLLLYTWCCLPDRVCQLPTSVLFVVVYRILLLFTGWGLPASYKCLSLLLLTGYCCCLQDIVVHRIGSASFLQVSFLMLLTGYCCCLQDGVCQLPTSVPFVVVYRLLLMFTGCLQDRVCLFPTSVPFVVVYMILLLFTG